LAKLKISATHPLSSSPLNRGVRGALCFSGRSTADAYGERREHFEHEQERAMRGELPMDRQAVQVQLGNGEWQAGTDTGGQVVDLYGLPLDHRKITSWRPAGGNASGGVTANRTLRTESRAPN